MPRNRSEKLPQYASGWSKDGIALACMFGQGLAKKLGREHAGAISNGNYKGIAVYDAEDAFRTDGPARLDYNRNRKHAYTLVAHFFKEAHAQKSK